MSEPEHCAKGCSCDRCVQCDVALDALGVLQSRLARSGGDPAGASIFAGLMSAFSAAKGTHDDVVDSASVLCGDVQDDLLSTVAQPTETAVLDCVSGQIKSAADRFGCLGLHEITDAAVASFFENAASDPNCFFPKDFQRFLLTGRIDRLHPLPLPHGPTIPTMCQRRRQGGGQK